MAASKAPSPEDDVWQAADKYRSIVHYMAEYTNQLLKCSRDGELFITDHLSNVLGHLEIKMMELAGEDGFNSFVIETLDELKSGILGNICQVLFIYIPNYNSYSKHFTDKGGVINNL